MFAMLPRLSAALLLCLAMAPAAWAIDYVDGFEAVPVMPGLSQSPEGSIVFDKPEGRILQAALSGHVDAAHAFEYYGRTLHSLGWQMRSSASPNLVIFERETEQLSLEWEPAQGASASNLILRLNPAP
jgi:hypothetical protein